MSNGVKISRRMSPEKAPMHLPNKKSLANLLREQQNIGKRDQIAIHQGNVKKQKMQIQNILSRSLTVKGEKKFQKSLANGDREVGDGGGDGTMTKRRFLQDRKTRSIRKKEKTKYDQEKKREVLKVAGLGLAKWKLPQLLRRKEEGEDK